MSAPTLEFVPADILQQMVNMKPYLLLLLKKGPKYNEPQAQQIIQAEHLPYLFALRAAGTVLLSMPVMDQTDIAAIGIYAVTDKEEASRLAEADPAVKQGVFTYELLHSIGMNGDTLTSGPFPLPCSSDCAYRKVLFSFEQLWPLRWRQLWINHGRLCFISLWGCITFAFPRML